MFFATGSFNFLELPRFVCLAWQQQIECNWEQICVLISKLIDGEDFCYHTDIPFLKTMEYYRKTLNISTIFEKWITYVILIIYGAVSNEYQIDYHIIWNYKKSFLGIIKIFFEICCIFTFQVRLVNLPFQHFLGLLGDSR